jgi:amino acid transporter
MTTSFAVMCNALVGIELASTMGDEIRDPARDLGPAIAIAGRCRSRRTCSSPVRC